MLTWLELGIWMQANQRLLPPARRARRPGSRPRGAGRTIPVAEDTLRSVGIDVDVDSPNVDARLREHRVFMMQFRLAEGLGYNELLRTVVPRRKRCVVCSALARQARRLVAHRLDPDAGWWSGCS
jgi:hypothetical protein